MLSSPAVVNSGDSTVPGEIFTLRNCWSGRPLAPATMVSMQLMSSATRCPLVAAAAKSSEGSANGAGETGRIRPS